MQLIKKSTGHFADISITSFYGSHIINCAGNGGMVCFNDKKHEKAKLLRSWGRSSSLYDENSKKLKIDLILNLMESNMTKNLCSKLLDTI